jgi:nickel-dependent lactate racemase
LLHLLLEQGIEKDKVSILISSGTHDLMNEREICLKLGRRIAEEYNILLHHCKRGNVFIGRTSRGTPVYINRHLLGHNLIIGVGGIVPHNPAGFGGGAKLILGVCGIRTIMHFHRFRKGAGTGGNIENEFRLDVQEAARMAGLNFIVNTLVNREREVIDLFSGDLEEAFNCGVAAARKLFSVPHPDSAKFDLVIADVYPFDASFAFTRK